MFIFLSIKADYNTFFLLFSNKYGNEVQLWTIFDCLNSLFISSVMHALNFPKNWLISHLNFMSSAEIFFEEVKDRRKILINQHPVILEPNIRKKFQIFLGIKSKFFIISN
jgi:hypothetical protein